jgi:TolB-like protein/Flp pilus assembly protein TadD
MLAAWVGRSRGQAPAVPSAPPCRADIRGQPILAAQKPPEGGISVLSFLDASDDSTVAYVAEALADDIVWRLRSLKLFEVNGQLAIRTFAPLSAGEMAIFGQLHGARYLLTGAVRKTQQGIGVTVRLSETQMGLVVWSADFDRPENSLLALSRQIVQEVTGRMAGSSTNTAPQLAAMARRDTRDPEAYLYFLRGNYYAARQSSARNQQQSVFQYTHATQRDPNYGEAFARLAASYVEVLDHGWKLNGMSADAIYAAGWSAAERARQVSPNSASGWLARAALLELKYPRTFQGALAAYDQALVLQPTSAQAYRLYGQALMALGDETGAETRLRRALTIDAQDAAANYEMARLEARRRHFGEACRLLNQVIDVAPGFAEAYALRGLVRLRQGEVRDAWSDAETASQLGNSMWGQAIAALADSRALDSTAARVRTKRLWRETTASVRQLTWWNAGYLALALSTVGDSAMTLDVLEHITPRGAVLWSGLQDQGFDKLRPAARFQALLEGSKPGK